MNMGLNNKMMCNYNAIISAVVLALLAAACEPNSSIIETSPVKKEIGKYLHEPKAVRWGEIKSVKFLEEETGKYVDGACGYLNSKNRYGAYTGYTSFIYAVRSDGEIVRMYHDGFDDLSFSIEWRKSCKGMELKRG